MLELKQKIETELQDIFDNEPYKNYLERAVSLHEQSPRNAMLIHMQNSQATHVASYATWTKLNRQVKKGEKGIAVFAPSKVTLMQPKTDGSGDEKIVRIRFKTTYVFDISQTEGEPLKDIKQPPKDYNLLFEALKQFSTYPISFETSSMRNDLYNSVNKNKISVPIGLSDEGIIKTILNQVALLKIKDFPTQPSNIEKFEADSITYMLVDYFNVGNLDFHYNSDVIKGLKLSELKQCLENISTAANELIIQLESEIKDLQIVEPNKNIVTSLNEKLSNAKNQIQKNSNQKGEHQNEKPFDF